MSILAIEYRNIQKLFKEMVPILSDRRLILASLSLSPGWDPYDDTKDIMEIFLQDPGWYQAPAETDPVDLWMTERNASDISSRFYALADSRGFRAKVYMNIKRGDPLATLYPGVFDAAIKEGRRVELDFHVHYMIKKSLVKKDETVEEPE